MIGVAGLSTRAWLHVLAHPGFNLQMAYAGIAVLLIATAGCVLTSVHVPDAGTLALGFGAIAVVTLPVALFLQEKKKFYLCESLLTIVWAFFFTLMLGYPVTVAARLGMNIPLQDLRFEQWDRWLGIDVLSIQAWSFTHWLGEAVNTSYLMLFPFMQIAVLLPIFMGKLKCAQRFVAANLVAFSIGLPIFALLPGVAPWFIEHYTNAPGAELCKQVVLLAIRQPGPYLYRYPAGAICLPSFHAIWAILSVQALWGFRYLRIPAFLFGTVIVFSTVTTGNHYVVDVIAGIVIALASMWIADRASRSFAEHQAPSIRFWRA